MLSIAVAFVLQAMNALFGLRDSVHVREGSPLQVWLKRHGAGTVAKYNELLSVGGVGPVTFQAETPTKTFSAYIDPESKFADVDKLSQVMDACQTISCIMSEVLIRTLK